MIAIGQFNTLKILHNSTVGLFLGDQEGNEVLLPNKFVRPDMEEGAMLEVFVYTDSDDRPTATTQKPMACANEFAFLKVKEVNQVGAFLDWGLDKDLLVPFRNQAHNLQEGRAYLVYIYVDNVSNRLAATAKVNAYIEVDEIPLKVGEEVDVLITNRTDIGTQAMVNNKYRGLIYLSETYRTLYPGEKMKGYVKCVREDGKVDVSLQKPGHLSIEPNAQLILDKLKSSNIGFLALHDNSPSEDIAKVLQMSKKSFKKAIGALYKDKLVRLEKDGVYLEPHPQAPSHKERGL